MQLTNSEKLILVMLSEVYEKLDIKGESGVDPKFIQSAIFSGHTWGVEWKYSWIFDNPDAQPPELNDVINILDMWSIVEEAYEAFDDDQKAQLEQLTPLFGMRPAFPGFDGNGEDEFISIATFLTEQLDRFTRFKGRICDRGTPSVAGYRRMCEVLETFQPALFNRRLTVNELAQILSAASDHTELT
ncbi:MAG: YfbU family protein [Dechloromonas sp.]|jgi:hypothetical protein|nr:MAG: YfbU family protein [Dechloromonas sp.]